MKCWGSSWQQLEEGRGEGRQQQFEENKMGRVRSISSGRIPLKRGRSISSSRVGIGARRVRSTSAARSVEASRRPLGEHQMGLNEEMIGGESTLQSSRESGDRFNERKQCTSASPSRAHSKG